MSLRLLFLLTFISSSVSTFASSNTFSVIQGYHHQRTKMDLFKEYNPFLAIPELEEERFLYHCTRLKPKIVYSSGHAKSVISVCKQLVDGFQYFKNNHSVDLKLASHLIAFPFQSFP